MPSHPYCSNCKYDLTGATESSKCPECGQPLVEVLTRDPFVSRFRGKRYRSKLEIFGRPLLSIALGPHENELRGHAKGIIAIGDIATGWLALGGVATGAIAVGGLAVGIFAIGGAAIGLVALGGGAIGGVALGGAAIGGVVEGGGVAGLVASGGGAAGYYAKGAGAFGAHVISVTRTDPQALQFYTEWAWLLGPPSLSKFSFLLPMWSCAALFLWSLALAALVGVGYLLQRKRSAATW